MKDLNDHININKSNFESLNSMWLVTLKYTNKVVFIGYLVITISFTDYPMFNSLYKKLMNNNWEIAEIVLLLILLILNVLNTIIKKDNVNFYFKKK